MTNTPQKSERSTKQGSAPKAGMDKVIDVSSAWFQAVADLNAEVAGFVAERIREDVKTQHEIMHCKTVDDLQRVQARFIQKAVDQYQAETGKLVEMGAKALTPKDQTG